MKNIIIYTLCTVFSTLCGIICAALLVLDCTPFMPLYDFVCPVFAAWFAAGGWLAADELVHGDDKDEKNTTTTKSRRS